MSGWIYFSWVDDMNNARLEFWRSMKERRRERKIYRG
jgi:hypothetical protein